MLPEAVRQVNPLMVAVPDTAAALEWYERALGAEQLWRLGRTVGIAVEDNYFFIGEPADTGGAGRVTVFVVDPDSFVGRALAAGADGSVGDLHDQEAPWGTHRLGAFVDPFGHPWAVSDRSPLSWHGPGRTHHVGYVQAVVGALEARGIATGHLVDRSTDIPVGAAGPTPDGERRRVAGVGLDDVLVWDRFDWANSAELAWDEEFGWTMDITHEPGAVRGTAHVRHRLGRGVAPDPAEIALQVAMVFTTTDHVPSGEPRRYREAGDHDPALEAALAAHLPGATGPGSSGR